MFFCEICEIFKNTYFEEGPRTTASEPIEQPESAIFLFIISVLSHIFLYNTSSICFYHFFQQVFFEGGKRITSVFSDGDDENEEIL